MPLDPKSRAKILSTIEKLVLKRHINVAGVDYEAWRGRLRERTPELLSANTDEFETGVQMLLGELGTSHAAFYHQRPTRLQPQHSINASLRSITENGNEQWMFLDVFEDGPAHTAGVRPGDLLIAVDGAPCVPPTMPTFQMGHKYALTVSNMGGANRRDATVHVVGAKGTKDLPPMLEPKSIVHSVIPPNVGLLKIAWFGGGMGKLFAKSLDSAVRDLKERGADRLIIDLRGNIGGGLGFARLAGYLCAGQIPIGYSLTPQRLRKGYNKDALARVPMPESRLGLVLTLSRFAFQDKSILLLTQGLGAQSFHGRIAVLVNECTNSAAEMVASFAAENQLATVVGQRTAGRVLGAANFKVGSGYWLRLPVMGWYTPSGLCLDGKGVSPDVEVEVNPHLLNEGVDQQLDRAIEVVSDGGMRRTRVTQA
jgi:C-terminal processing protease CtpA/Prc